MGKANTPTGPSDTLWNMSTSEPITTGSTSTSEVSKSMEVLYRSVVYTQIQIPKYRLILTHNCGSWMFLAL